MTAAVIDKQTSTVALGLLGLRGAATRGERERMNEDSRIYDHPPIALEPPCACGAVITGEMRSAADMYIWQHGPNPEHVLIRPWLLPEDSSIEMERTLFDEWVESIHRYEANGD